MDEMTVIQKNVRKKSSMKTAKRKDLIFICVMLSIPIVQWLVFWFGVNINSILMAFQNPMGEWDLVSFKAVFNSLKDVESEWGLGVAVQNTFKYFVKDFCMLFLHLLIAYFFYKKIWGKRIFQVVLYIPSIISAVAMVEVFSNFIAADGPLGILLQNIGEKFDPNYIVPAFLARSDTATATILFYTVWLGWGGNMLLLGGALARIPLEIIESARLDGIGTWREIFHIIIPLIWPTVSTILILMLTGLFTADGPILLFLKGKMLYKTHTIGYWIYCSVIGVGTSAYNQVSAAGLLFTVVGVPIIMSLRWLIEKVPAAEY